MDGNLQEQTDLAAWIQHFKAQAERQEANNSANARNISRETGSIGDTIIKIGPSGNSLTAATLNGGANGDDSEVSGTVQQSVLQAEAEIARDKQGKSRDDEERTFTETLHGFKNVNGHSLPRQKRKVTKATKGKSKRRRKHVDIFSM